MLTIFKKFNKKLVILLVLFGIIVSSVISLCACNDEKYYEYFNYYNAYGEGGCDDWICGDDVPSYAPGLTFMGAFSEPDGKGDRYFDENGHRIKGMTVKESQNIYGYFVPNTYNFVNDYDESCNFSIEYNTEMSQIAVPQKYGYAFVGWSLSTESRDLFTDGSGNVLADYKMFKCFILNDSTIWWHVLENYDVRSKLKVKMYAIFDVIKYNVVLDYGKSAIENTSFKIEHGKTVSQPEQKIYGNEGVVGWTYESGIEYNDEPILSDITLIAVWAQYSTASFYDGYNDVGSEMVFENIPLTKFPTVNKTGYSVAGWYDNPNFDGQAVTSISFNNVSDGYYVKWTPIVYKVQYVTGTNEKLNPTQFTYEEKTDLRVPTESGNRVFIGWNTNADGKGDFVTEIVEGSVGDMVLYAIWDSSIPISNADGLYSIKDNPTSNYHLTCDINLTHDNWVPIPSFSGIFDGKGHTIENFSIDTHASGSYGFFATNNGTIKNVEFADFTVNANIGLEYNYIGIVVGVNNGTVSNCKALDGNDEQIKFNMINASERDYCYIFVGDIVGKNYGTIKGCVSSSNISGSARVYSGWGGFGYNVYHRLFICGGGICGESIGGKIESCESSVKIDVSIGVSTGGGEWSRAFGYIRIGGIVGFMSVGEVEHCVTKSYTRLSATTSNVGSNSSVESYMGGIIGVNCGSKVEACKSNANISAKGDWGTLGVGGVVGINTYETVSSNNIVYGNISNCLSDSANITASGKCIYMGGLVGQNIGQTYNCLVRKAIITRAANDTAYIGAFCGYNSDSGRLIRCAAYDDCRIRFITGDNESGSMDKATAQCFLGNNGGGIVQGCVYSDAVKVYVFEKTAATYVMQEALSCTYGECHSDDEIMSEEFLRNSLKLDESFWDYTTLTPIIKI